MADIEIEIEADIQVDAEIDVQADVELEVAVDVEVNAEFEVELDAQIDCNPEVDVEIEIGAPEVQLEGDLVIEGNIEAPIMENEVGGNERAVEFGSGHKSMLSLVFGIMMCLAFAVTATALIYHLSNTQLKEEQVTTWHFITYVAVLTACLCAGMVCFSCYCKHKKGFSVATNVGVSAETGGNTTIELAADCQDLEIEVTVEPEFGAEVEVEIIGEVEIEIEAPEVEIEVEVEAPEVEVELEIGAEIELEAEVEVEIEV